MRAHTGLGRATTGPPGAADEAFLRGGGELGRLIAGFDWATTPLGPIAEWKQSLRSAVSICLSSRFPIVMYWGPELTVIYNDAYSEILGAKHPWALGKPCAVCWAEIWDTIGPMLSEVVTSGNASWSDDLELLLERNGAPEECYFSFSFSPVRVEDGSVGGVFTAVVETTRRVLDDRRLRVLSRIGEQATGARSGAEAAQRCVDAMAETRSLPFASIYLNDADGPPRLAASTGLAQASFASLPEWPFDEVAADGRPRTVSLEPTPLSPEVAWAHGLQPSCARIAPIAIAESGRPGGFLVAGVNPLRPLDAEYVGFFELLAKAVSGAVVQGQAYEAERRRAEALAELDRAKTEFFSNVSHEFRTPLTLMLGPLESLLSEAEPGSRQAHDLEMARRNALRLLKLVNTLLDFARIESARREARLEPVELGTITAELASVFRSAVEQAGLRLVVDCAPLSRPVEIDPDMWERVVLNLLSNALKFTLEGEIAVRVAEADGNALLTVSDTGSGIADDELPRVFDRFYRTRQAAGRTHEGAGIGLALVKELVEIMGGRLEVTSRLGEGTEFKVSIPFERASSIPATVSQKPESSLSRTSFTAEAMGWTGTGPAPAGPDAGSAAEGRILLVDDNADMRTYLTGVLRERWEVEPVADGAEALTAARRTRPDLILTDVMMPRLDGAQLLAAIRADDALSDVPVVILSARAGDEAIDGLAQGADDYLVKPFSVQELVARVSANMKLAKMRADLARSRAALGLAGERASFLNLAAHELRTPLTVIGGYVDLILSGVLDDGPETRAALEKVAHKTKEGVRLIEQMLTAARMESGTISMHATSVDLSALAQDAAARARPLAELEGTQIVTARPGEAVLALIDAALVSLILDNLIANAIYHGAGPIRIEVLSGPPRVRVVDSGPGVERSERHRIFEPFYQVETQVGAHGGAGLGLAVSRRLAEMHGGTLVLEETPGGASFLLTVPAAEPASSPLASAGL